MPVPDIHELEARMRPEAFSRAGFLGPTESLEQILEADRAKVERLHLTFEQIAEKLDSVLRAAEACPRRSFTSERELRVDVDIFPGFQICPWATDPHHAQCSAGGGVRHASVSWRIRNLKTGQEMRGPGLIVHLMRDHHFCEGHGSPFRVDPSDLARLLNLI
jgi:hypothetical protein